MITTNKDQITSLLEAAVAEIGGSIADTGNGWRWENSGLQVDIKPSANALFLTRELNEAPLTDQPLSQIARALHGWLEKNTTLPPAHRIVVHDDNAPVQQAIIPTQIDTELDPAGLIAVLKGFSNISSTPSTSVTSFPPEAIESWAAEADVRLSTNTEAEETQTHYSIKLRGFEPAQLEVTDHITLHIDASPLLETSAESKDDTVSRSACALLATGATAASQFIRAELSDDTLGYRATFISPKNVIPPAAWLAQAVHELTAVLRASRIELEALYTNLQLASQYLTARNITTKS